ncbi:MAG: hypothetical protein ACPL1Y_01025 [Thermoplasmata archaeon]
MVKAEQKTQLSSDWFRELEEELTKKTEEIIQTVSEERSRKMELNRILIADFMRIWDKFNDIHVHITMDPPHNLYATFKNYPKDWEFKSDFDFSLVDAIQLVDKTQAQGRVGDSIKFTYYNDEKGVLHLRGTFEYCEGESYYKYSGWKRIFNVHVLFDAPVSKVDLDRVHQILADVVKTWYESHLKKNRDLLLAHIKNTYEKGETYTQ